MKRHSYLIFLHLLLTALFNVSVAQSFEEGSVHGTLKDSSGAAILNASVTLQYTSPDTLNQNKMAKISITLLSGKAGEFHFTSINSGTYMPIIKHMGYDDKVNSIKIAAGEKVILEPIVLTVKTKSLTNVTVTATKPLIEQASDRIIYNVENDPMAKSETAVDLLRKTPFVSVDGDNNIQVNGQSNFRVLLNGKETGMFSQNIKEALLGFPGSLITKIEVITSPSAKYDAEGVGGIINIITKKKVEGYNGSITMNAQTNRENIISASFSLRGSKIGATLFSNSYIKSGVIEGLNYETVQKQPMSFATRKLSGNRLLEVFMNNGNGELNWQLDSLSVFSLYGNTKIWNFQTVATQIMQTNFTNGTSDVAEFSLIQDQQFPTISIGSDYVKKYTSKKDKEWSIRFNSEFSKTESFLSSEQEHPFWHKAVRNNSFARNREFTMQTDYILPLKNSRRIDMGAKSIFRRAFSDFESLSRYKAIEDYSINPDNTDRFNYSQNVYSAYSSYRFTIKNVNLRLGARWEYTEIKGNFISSRTKADQSYGKLLPNLQATIRLNGFNTIEVAYNERIQRPFINSLNPFVNNNDSLNLTFGNPQLDPQTIRALSLQGRLPLGQSFVGLTVSGSYSDDMIVQYTDFDNASGISRITSANLGREWQLGLQVNSNFKMNQNWSLILNSALRWIQIENKANLLERNKGITGNGNFNSTLKLTKKMTMSNFISYSMPRLTIQGRSNWFLWYGSGVNYKFIQDKLTATLNLNNFFQKNRDFIFMTEGETFRTTNTFVNPYRNLRLALTWNFGKLKENVSKKKGVVNDDLINN